MTADPIKDFQTIVLMVYLGNLTAGSDFTPLPLTETDDSSQVKSNYPDNMLSADHHIAVEKSYESSPGWFKT